MASLRNHPRLVGVAGVVILIIAAAAGLALSFDPNAEKGRIIAAVRRATGRDLVLAGPLRLTYGLHPTLQAEDIAFANAPGGSRPQMITAAQMAVQVALLPLLSRRVEIDHVTLVRPDILLETDAQGHGNWQFQRPAPSAAAPSGPASPSGERTTVALNSLSVEDGRVTWRGQAGQPVTVDVPRATLEVGDGPTHLVAQARLQTVPITLDATLGTRAQLGGLGAWPVVASLTAGDATLKLNGTTGLPLLAHGYHGRVDLAAPDLARLGALLQQAGLRRHPLPPLHDLRFGATLAGEGLIPTPQDVSLHIGASSLGAFALTKLDVTWPSATQPAQLDAAGSYANAPWQVSSGLAQAGQGVALRALHVTSGFGDAEGDVAIRYDGRPSIRGTLVSQRLNLDALPRLPEAAPAPAPAAAAPPPAAPQPAVRRVFSDAPLPWKQLRRADLDLQLSIADLVLRGVDYRGAAGHLVLQDGALHLDPMTVQAPEGRIDLSFSTDGSQADPPMALALRSGAFALDPLLRAAGLPGGSDAALQVDLALNSTGLTPHALASHLDGHAGLALVDGDVSNAVLTAVLGDVLHSARIGLDPAGRSHVRCFATRLNAAQGQVAVAALKLDATRLDVEGTGTINLADETLALRLRPLLRLGGAGVLAPVRLDGALTRPVAQLDAPPGSGRPGVIIGGVAGPPDDCGAALTAARDGAPGPMPAEAVKKGFGKPADLLRSFLR